MLNINVVLPMPIAMVSTAESAKAGLLRSTLPAYRTSLVNASSNPEIFTVSGPFHDERELGNSARAFVRRVAETRCLAEFDEGNL